VRLAEQTNQVNYAEPELKAFLTNSWYCKSLRGN